MDTIEVEDKMVQVFPAHQETSPLVILHTVENEGETVYQSVKKFTDIDFSLASIGHLKWYDEMSPWTIEPLFQGDTPCSGGADAYLRKLTGHILPMILNQLPGSPTYIALAGYSLAGLFAVYAMYRTDLFARIASASGSFWYPDFLSYAQREEIIRKPECIYFSLGNREAKTRNKVLQTVEKNTYTLVKGYREKDIEVTMEMNDGNHFQNSNERMAKGICWILEKDV